MIIPAKKQLKLWLAMVLLSVAVAFLQYKIELSLPLFWGVLSLLLGVLLVDGVRLFSETRQVKLMCERHISPILAVDSEHVVNLRISNLFSRSVWVNVFDHVPALFNVLQLPQQVMIKQGGFAEINYRTKPTQRGHYQLEKVQCRALSSWGMWQKNIIVDCQSTVKVYPNFSVFDNKSIISQNELGFGEISRQRKRGIGTEFMQLRDYRVGDSLRQIDYKASSRMGKMISREYQIEKDQQVMVMLDCSRRMHIYQDDISHFDYALNATVYLARTILQQGDAVGMMNFAANPGRFVKPRKGRHMVNGLLNQMFDLDSSHEFPDYIKAAEAFIRQQKRRCLVVVITSLQDDDAESIKLMLKILQKKHLVLVVNLKEMLLKAPIEINNLDDANYYAAREVYLSDRETAIQKIKNEHLLLLDTYPNRLNSRLINSYLNIKQAGIF